MRHPAENYQTQRTIATNSPHPLQTPLTGMAVRIRGAILAGPLNHSSRNSTTHVRLGPRVFTLPDDDYSIDCRAGPADRQRLPVVVRAEIRTTSMGPGSPDP